MKIKTTTYAFLALFSLFSVACSDKDEVVVPDIPPSDGTVLTLNGGAGGAGAQNSVFVGFSTDTQDSVLRYSWDLAFYSGSEFRVRLNNFAGSAAIETEFTNLTEVTSANFDISTLAIGQGQGTLSMIDNPSGEISGTFIDEISAATTGNKVYVISTKGGTAPVLDDVYKVLITRNSSGGYILQYAKLDATNIASIEVSKDTEYNFSFVSFVTGGFVSGEPKKTDWDIVWSYSMYYTATFPYAFSDMVFINNLGGATATEVLTETVSYADFSESNITSLTFDNSRNVIGSNWRATTGTIGVKQDRFYVVKDAAGNVYKLKFNSFHASDGGVRGYPEIEYALVKRGS
ncbi:HmuY family protein [Olivibacter sitiensis]|uniref:HmuY family protein n=1 Tax=Olivibacter sitiensis TaxID=376470 RepID=UPI000420E92B|nr:HmuY family protein [Olivibacter sitiensis]